MLHRPFAEVRRPCCEQEAYNPWERKSSAACEGTCGLEGKRGVHEERRKLSAAPLGSKSIDDTYFVQCS